MKHSTRSIRRSLALALGVVACFVVGVESFAQAADDYTLTVEASPAVGAGGTVYRFYVNMLDPTDRMSAVYGNDDATLNVETPAGAFNSPFNSSWNASGINPAFLGVFPDLADDTYATIGHTGPASTSGIAGAADPSVVEDASQPITPYFLTPGATSLLANTLTGASWYILNTAANGLPDADLRVLLMQVTTTGDISGQINFQVFPLGDGANSLLTSVEFDGAGTFSGLGAGEVPGCTDVAACNYDDQATLNDGTCDFCSCLGDALEGYGLELEVVTTHDEGVLAGLTTYRLYVTTPHDDDVLSAVYGDDESPLHISSTTSFYQSPFGTALGSNINPLLFGAFPDLQYDSWVTIGLDGPAGANEVAPSTIGDLNNQWVTNFELGMNIVIEDSIGGAMFVPNDPGTLNTLSGADQRILIGQFTTDGEMSGLVNVQMFNHGSNLDESRVSIEFNGVGATGTEDVVCGCMDPEACNYDETATNEDGTCTYPEAPYACDGTCVNDTDNDGVCDELEVLGCTDPTACNFEEGATEDDGNCEYPEAWLDCTGECLNDSNANGVCDELEGCLDELACNYDPSAEVGNDALCVYPEAPYLDCDGNCLNDSDADGVCDEIEFPGCMDPEACNYDPIYTDDAGNCYYAEEFYDCFFNCLNDANDNGICDELEVFGCMDPEDCNYNPNANMDDGSCGDANVANDACVGASLLTCGSTVLANNSECSSTDDDPGCATFQPANPSAGLWFTFVGTGTEVTLTTCLPGTIFDTYMSVYTGTCGNLTCVAGNDDQSEPYYNDLCEVFAFASTVVMDTELGEQYWVLIQGVEGGVGTFELGMTCVVEGCMDAEACNFVADATVDDGSCEYAEVYLNCDGTCINDLDGDGVCDELEVLGCTDPEASNFEAGATEDDGSCTYCNLSISAEELQGNTCAGDSAAVWELSFTGATNVDSLNLLVNGELVTSGLLEGLAAGTYTVSATKGDACEAVLTFTVSDGASVAMSVTSQSDVLCAGEASGSLEVLATGGAEPYMYDLDGPVAASSSTGVFEGLPAGTYTVVASDANGCEASLEVAIGSAEPLEGSAVVTQAATEGTGAIALTVTGGTEPYEFAWTSDAGFVSSDEDISNLFAPAAYTVEVTDANGCTLVLGPYDVDDVYAVHEANLLEVRAFPNPASDQVLIAWQAAGTGSLRVVDASGRLVHQEQVSAADAQTRLDVHGWANGTYHVHLFMQHRVGQFPLVVAH